MNKSKFDFQPPIFREDPECSPFWSRSVMLFFLVLSIAIVVRVAQFLFLRTSDPSFTNILPGIDTQAYDDLAKAILNGDFLLRSIPIHYMGPLYPYYLAAIYFIFGHNYEAAHAVQFTIGAISAAIIFLAAKQWFSNRVSFLAGLFAALSSTVIVYEGYLLPEGMIFLLVSIFILISGLARHRPNNLWLWVGLGISIGLISIQRANFLLCAVGVLLWIFLGFAECNFRHKLARASLLFFGIAITLAPVTLHNRIFGGDWVLVTSNGPANFYIGNGIEANGTYYDGSLYKQHAKEVSAGTTTWTRLLANEIVEAPLSWISLMFKKIYLFWAAYDPPDNFNYALYKQFSPVTQAGLFPYFVIICLGFIGMATVWSKRLALMELYAFVLVYMISVVLVFVSGRFRLPIMVPMFLFSAVGCWKIFSWLQSRQRQRLAMALLFIIFFMVFLNAYKIEPFPIRINDYSMLASYYDLNGNPRGAITSMQEAEKTLVVAPSGSPDFENLRNVSLNYVRKNLAKRLANAGHWQEARSVLENQIKTKVYDEDLIFMLAKICIQLNLKDEAVSLALQMLQQKPDSAVWKSLVGEAEAILNHE